MAASAASKIAVEECETGYKNEKGVECYEALKGGSPWS